MCWHQQEVETLTLTPLSVHQFTVECEWQRQVSRTLSVSVPHVLSFGELSWRNSHTHTHTLIVLLWLWRLQELSLSWDITVLLMFMKHLHRLCRAEHQWRLHQLLWSPSHYWASTFSPGTKIKKIQIFYYLLDQWALAKLPVRGPRPRGWWPVACCVNRTNNDDLWPFVRFTRPSGSQLKASAKWTKVNIYDHIWQQSML